MAAPIRDLGRIPGPVFIDNCWAVRLYWTLPNDKTAFNVLHAAGAGPSPPTQAFVDSLFTSIGTALTGSGLLANLDVETSFARVGLRSMESAGSGFGYSEWVSAGSAINGSAVAAGQGPMPHQVAFVVSLKTGLAGQANRGRVYLPGFHMNADDGNGLVKEAVAQNCVDFINGIKTSLSGVGLTLCIAHPPRQAYEGFAGAAHPARGAGTVEVTNISYLNLQWDTQRLRARL